ncbi:ethylbenzene dehydrogenase-related protein [Sediminibacterium sp.]|uniref:ethylbenzene dehydrogenase-related protein n=1 Tax=Sediminibacterium sp. TaxID=1917865 RepID=UPI0025EB2FC6|nr:ethylbenzene dehydrogenase-related protein [Sediminibacterium sp.]
MKFFNSIKFWIMTTVVCLVGYAVSCTKNDQVILPATSESSNVLLALKTTAAPTIDGSIDASWANAQKLSFSATVPDPGNGIFAGYIGENYTGTMRAMYDNTSVYFLVEVEDRQKDILRSPWYFNPTTQRWAVEPGLKQFDLNGKLTRDGFGEDKFAMLWDIDNSTPKFATQTCYASCHIYTPYLNVAVTPAVMVSNAGSGGHYTNGTNEKIDMWWLHPSRGFAYGIMDDNYQDWAGGPAVMNLVGGNGNGRHFDDLVVSGVSTTWPNRPTYTADATQGSVANTQQLKLDGTGALVSVPKYIIPASTGDYITVADTTSGAAKLVTGVSSTGVLSYTGGSIDPNIGTGYQRIGDPVTGSVGPNRIPGYIMSPVLRGRADIEMKASFSGTGWVYEFKRALKTGDVLKQDVDFTSLADQPFGIAYWNKSNNQHGIQPNLLLKFQK